MDVDGELGWVHISKGNGRFIRHVLLEEQRGLWTIRVSWSGFSLLGNGYIYTTEVYRL